MSHFCDRFRRVAWMLLGACSLATRGVGETPPLPAVAVEELARDFVSPPLAARPKTWWHWMNGNVTKAGITADLEAMKQIGLGGVQLFSLDYQIPNGPVKFMSSEWREAVRFAAAEAKRLGLDFGLSNSSGWSSTGGPWITPDLAMQRVVWSETPFSGDAHLQATLPIPEVGKYASYYHDIAVLAFETPAAEKISFRSAQPKITPAQLALPTPSDVAPQSVLLEFAQPFAARSLFFSFESGRGMVDLALQVSDDGTRFRTLATSHFRLNSQLSLDFPATSARFFRLRFTGRALDDTPVKLSKLELLNGFRVSDWPAKVGVATLTTVEATDMPAPPDGTIYRRERMIDLSDKIDAAGKLDWRAPPGNWTVFRFGYAPYGQRSVFPNIPEGDGLEVDKLSQAALDVHFQRMSDPLLKELGPLAGTTVTNLLIDSYEVGGQNWTAKFREEFRRRRGYDLLSYLPALTGRVVDSTDTTERFLWDLRQTIGELFAENYFGHFTALCHDRGLSAAFEAYGGPFAIADVTALADRPMAEFWTGNGYRRPHPRNRLVISGAHLGGQPVIGAEAFTSNYEVDRYTQDPFSLKTLGDFQFCEGINQFIFHRFAMQPWLDQAPGMTMGPYGLHFDRTVTWWKQGRAWIEYLSRCQSLLQAGTPVADLLIFAGEDQQAQARWGPAAFPVLPNGYDFEFVNASALLAATVVQHQIVLSNGAKFHVLVLPDSRRITSALATKISALVYAGARVIGPPPKISPSLGDAIAGDQIVRRVAAELWSDCDGRTVTEHASGQGMVFWGRSVEDVLTRFSVRPDFEFTSAIPGAQINFKHRKLPGAEIYFVSNQRERTVAIDAVFRASGQVPFYWHADTGAMEAVALYREKEGFVTIPLQLDAAESVFVIFRPMAPVDYAVALISKPLPFSAAEPRGGLTNEKGVLTLNASSVGDYTVERSRGPAAVVHVATIPAPVQLQGEWNVTFPPRLGAPDSITLGQLGSLSQQSEPGVRYFSGTASYTKTFDLAAEQLAPERAWDLDLGTVKNLAEVKINGVDFGVLWKPPFRARVTSALRVGKNSLEVKVTNLWANRLIGDEQLPDDCEWIPVLNRGSRLKEWPNWLVEHRPRSSGRIAFATWKFYSKNDPVPESGLIGPVTISAVGQIEIANASINSFPSLKPGN